MCRRAGTKMVYRLRWLGFGTMTDTRMASWRIKISRIGRLSRRPRRKFLLTAGRLGAAVLRPYRGFSKRRVGIQDPAGVRAYATAAAARTGVGATKAACSWSSLRAWT